MDNELSIVGAGSQFLVDYMRQVNMATQGQQKLPNDYEQPLVNDILANQDNKKLANLIFSIILIRLCCHTVLQFDEVPNIDCV